MRLLAILVLISISSASYSDERIQLPNGMECWTNRAGHVYGCSGGVGDTTAPAPQHSPSTCIELEAEITSINRRLRQGYSSSQGQTLKAKRREFESLHRKHCD